MPQASRPRLAVTVGGKDYALQALAVRLPGKEKLPVALITHGASPGKPRAATIDGPCGWAHDLAHRGWLAVAVMRRGYGESDGEVADNGGTCTSPDVGRYLDAFAGTGGRAELVMLPPFRDDGHALFYARGGKRRLLPELDRFLRANKLPTWDETAFEPLLARLSFADAQAVQQHLQSLTAEKALALAPGGGAYW